jgi:hypothetical protein
MRHACAITTRYIDTMTREQVKTLLDRVLNWPPERQEELAEIVLEIEAELGIGPYRATPDELQAIDEAERSGIGSEDEVEAAFRSFRRP